MDTERQDNEGSGFIDDGPKAAAPDPDIVGAGGIMNDAGVQVEGDQTVGAALHGRSMDEETAGRGGLGVGGGSESALSGGTGSEGGMGGTSTPAWGRSEGGGGTGAVGGIGGGLGTIDEGGQGTRSTTARTGLGDDAIESDTGGS